MLNSVSFKSVPRSPHPPETIHYQQAEMEPAVTPRELHAMQSLMEECFEESSLLMCLLLCPIYTCTKHVQLAAEMIPSTISFRRPPCGVYAVLQSALRRIWIPKIPSPCEMIIYSFFLSLGVDRFFHPLPRFLSPFLSRSHRHTQHSLRHYCQ